MQKQHKHESTHSIKVDRTLGAVYNINVNIAQYELIKSHTHPLGLLARRGGHFASRRCRIGPRLGRVAESDTFACLPKSGLSWDEEAHAPAHSAAPHKLLEPDRFSFTFTLCYSGLDDVANMRDANGRSYDERSHWRRWSH